MALPVGFHRFHRDANLNFQLNRLVSDGSSEVLSDVRAVAPRIRTFDDWSRELFALEGAAAREGRDEDALRYVRAAEFFLSPNDPRKAAAYERFQSRFERAAAGRFERHAVPYEARALPALRVRGPDSRGAIVVHGGFDSFVEEFFPMLEVMRDRGFDVIAFDGPGQGGALHRHGLRMTPLWEHPTAAVLDHFGVRDVTLVGISLGGCLAIRAAAFEPRIQRVVAYDVMEDFFECISSRRGRLASMAVDRALRAGGDGMVDRILGVMMKHDMLARWGMEQGMMVTGASSPSAFLRETMKYRTAPYSDRVTQDVLLLAGADDHFVPLAQLARQVATLVRARSVTERVFRGEEHASSHCQIGNLPLVLETIVTWIRARSSFGTA